MLGTNILKHKRLTLCAIRTIFFPKRKFKLYNGLFHSVYLVFSTHFFSIANVFTVYYLWKMYVMKHPDN